MSYIYLASPYSDPDPRVRKRRHLEAEAAVHWMLSHHLWVFSPIVHCHFLAEGYDLPRGIEFWLPYSQAMLEPAKAIWVLEIPGHHESLGIRQELKYAAEKNIPKGFITPLSGGTYTIGATP